MLRTTKKDEGYRMKAQTLTGVSSSNKYPSSNFVFFIDNFLNKRVLNNTMEQRRKDGTFSKGMTPWNYGVKTNLNLLDIYRKHWNENKSIIEISKELGVSDRLIRLRLKENGYNIRKKEDHPDRIKKKISKTMKEREIEPKEKYGGIAWNKGKNLHYDVWNKGKKTGLKNWKNRVFDEKVLNKIRESRAKQIFPKKDSQIELKMKKYLSDLEINFIQHKYISQIRHAYQCDFFIPKQEGVSKDTILECDGCYWHGCPVCFKETNKQQRKQKAKDNRRTKELKGQGFRVIRLWEHEINQMKLNDLKQKLK